MGLCIDHNIWYFVLCLSHELNKMWWLSTLNPQDSLVLVSNSLNANFPGFYNSMSKKPTITAFFEV
ncbi:hypothetical protein EFR23_08900 [Lactobacillus delbrueckii subsp. lactis]|nr:hypothetical protein [Lactobacillus delbrueckii subsp. lactis]